MKIKSNLKLREIAGEAIVLLQGKGGSDMTKVLALNESSKFLWETFVGKDFSLEDIVQALCGQYEVEEQRAREDARKWIEQLEGLNIFE